MIICSFFWSRIKISNRYAHCVPSFISLSLSICTASYLWFFFLQYLCHFHYTIYSHRIYSFCIVLHHYKVENGTPTVIVLSYLTRTNWAYFHRPQLVEDKGLPSDLFILNPWFCTFIHLILKENFACAYLLVLC